MSHLSRTAFGLVFLVLVAPPISGEEPKVDLAKAGKAATALVEASNNAQGTAFCIHPTGFFVTSEHVVRNMTAVTIALNPGVRTEQVLHARVVRTDAALDLALLQVNDQTALPALVLGADDGLAELAEVVAFGYPFGTALATSKKDRPAISVNLGRVTSLRKKEGELDRIQIDAVLNPGNSGGPVLDKQGKVVGVVVSGVRGAGVNFAIPVSHLVKFLDRPEIVFDPPTVRLGEIHLPVDFRARAVSLLPSNTKPFEVEFHLFADQQTSRKYKAELKGGAHTVRTELIPKPTAPAVLDVTAVFDRGTVVGKVEDRAARVAGTEVKLSDVARLSGAKKRLTLHDGTTLRGELKNLGSVPVDLGPTKVTLDLTSARTVRLERPKGLSEIGCTVVAFQEGKEVGRVTRPIAIEGLVASGDPGPDLDIDPPALAGDKVVYELTSAARDVAVGGGGRYLILHLPRDGKLAVFDVNEARVVKTIPAPDNDLKFTAGLEKLVVLLPTAKKIQRWDLTRFELEQTAPFTVEGSVVSLNMGCASRGPVYVTSREKPNPWVKFAHLSLDTLDRRAATLDAGHLAHFAGREGVHVRCSCDGQALGLWSAEGSPSGVAWVRWDGQIGKASYEHASRGYVVPGWGNMVVFTGSGLFTRVDFINPDQGATYPGTGMQVRYLPALHGDYFLSLGIAPQPNAKTPPPAAELIVHKRGRALPVLKRPDIDVPAADGVKDDFTLDKRVLLLPRAKVLVTIPLSNDRIVIHRLDPDAALEKAGRPGALQNVQDGGLAEHLEAIRLDPKNAKAHYNLGNALRVKGDPPGAIAAYREAIRLDPKFVQARTNLGNALQSINDWDGAIAAHREAIRLDPKFAVAHNGLGNALRGKNELGGAIAAYREAILLDPTYFPAHYNLGNALKVKGDLPGAIAAYREAIRLNPKYAQAHNNLGTALQSTGDLDAAIAYFREAINLDPKLPQPRSNLDRVLKLKAERDARVAPPPRPVDH
jgi:tetratricopeptide (TPR) repeat protein